VAGERKKQEKEKELHEGLSEVWGGEWRVRERDREKI
jgi:hypothetical protein